MKNAPAPVKFFDWKLYTHLAGLFFLMAAMISMGVETLDQRLYYTGAEAREFFARLSAQSAANYRLVVSLDFAFIALYTFTLVLAFARLYARPLLYWLAVAPGIFDLIETGSIFHILNFGETFPVLSWLGVATALKWASTAVVTGMLVRGALRRAR